MPHPLATRGRQVSQLANPFHDKPQPPAQPAGIPPAARTNNAALAAATGAFPTFASPPVQATPAGGPLPKLTSKGPVDRSRITQLLSLLGR